MERAARNSRTPIFFFQTANDFDISPTLTLSAVKNKGGKPFQEKIYPPFGDSVMDGHTFGYFGSKVWAEDVFRFLERYCGKGSHA